MELLTDVDARLEMDTLLPDQQSGTESSADSPDGVTITNNASNDIHNTVVLSVKMADLMTNYEKPEASSSPAKPDTVIPMDTHSGDTFPLIKIPDFMVSIQDIQEFRKPKAEEEKVIPEDIFELAVLKSKELLDLASESGKKPESLGVKSLVDQPITELDKSEEPKNPKKTNMLSPEKKKVETDRDTFPLIKIPDFTVSTQDIQKFRKPKGEITFESVTLTQEELFDLVSKPGKKLEPLGANSLVDQPITELDKSEEPKNPEETNMLSPEKEKVGTDRFPRHSFPNLPPVLLPKELPDLASKSNEAPEPFGANSLVDQLIRKLEKSEELKNPQEPNMPTPEKKIKTDKFPREATFSLYSSIMPHFQSMDQPKEPKSLQEPQTLSPKKDKVKTDKYPRHPYPKYSLDSPSIPSLQAMNKLKRPVNLQEPQTLSPENKAKTDKFSRFSFPKYSPDSTSVPAPPPFGNKALSIPDLKDKTSDLPQTHALPEVNNQYFNLESSNAHKNQNSKLFTPSSPKAANVSFLHNNDTRDNWLKNIP